MRRPNRYRYLLGDSQREAARLKAQSRLWDPTSHALFDRLKVRRGWRVLEIGPGQGSLHLELRRRVAGPVDAVERSPIFAKRLHALCARDHFGRGQIWQCDLGDTPLPKASYDLIFARWVFLFLPDPALHLAKLVTALKPGGRIAVQDYYRDTLAMIPSVPEWPAFLAADRAFFASQGGDANIASRLPTLYRAAGLEEIEIEPTIHTGHPGSPVWDWLSNYFLAFMDRYGAFSPFGRAGARALAKRWRAAAHDPSSLLIAPAVLDVVGRKPNAKVKR